MEDAAANVVRRFDQELDDADFQMAEQCFTPGALWHLPENSPMAGDHRGWEPIRDNFLAKLGPLSGVKEDSYASLQEGQKGRYLT